MLLQVHDELVFEADTGFVDDLIAGATQRMAAAAELRVPLVVDCRHGRQLGRSALTSLSQRFGL